MSKFLEAPALRPLRLKLAFFRSNKSKIAVEVGINYAAEKTGTSIIKRNNFNRGSSVIGCPRYRIRGTVALYIRKNDIHGRTVDSAGVLQCNSGRVDGRAGRHYRRHTEFGLRHRHR